MNADGRECRESGVDPFDGGSIYFSLFLCGIDTSLFPRKTWWCLRGVPLLFLSCEGAQRLQSVKDRRPGAVGGKGEVLPRGVWGRMRSAFSSQLSAFWLLLGGARKRTRRRMRGERALPS